jgi:hypothetical protein
MEGSSQWSLSNLQQVLPAFISNSTDTPAPGQPAQQLVIDIVNRRAQRPGPSPLAPRAVADDSSEHGVSQFSESIIRHLTQRRVTQEEPAAAGQEVADASPGESAAAAAERHRLTSTPEIDFQVGEGVMTPWSITIARMLL